jgi:hypothetical protein
MEWLTHLHTPTLMVVLARHAARDEISALAAELALRGPLTILDSGNRVAPYQITHRLRQRTTDIASAAKRIFIRRAFTCYQMVALLENTPALTQPYLVLDLLASFYDDNVRFGEAQRLLGLCLKEIERLVEKAPVVIALAPPLVAERASLIEQVCARATRVITIETPMPLISQPALF